MFGSVDVPAGSGACNAMMQVLVEQLDADTLEGLADCGDLGQDVDAVGVVLDHSSETTDLALDRAKPSQQQLLVVGIAGKCVHVWEYTPQGYDYGRSVYVGRRFSRNAAMPSCASWVVARRDIISTAYAYASVWPSSVWA